MSSKRRLTLVTCLVLAGVLLAVAPVAARATRTEYEYNIPHVCAPTDFGTWTFTPSGNVQIRGMVIECIDEDPVDSRWTGHSRIVINDNLDGPLPGGEGPMWGTVTFWSTTHPGGMTVGTVEGRQMADGSVYLHNVGHGQGLFEGITYWGDESPLGTHVVVLDPHGN
jgi:hypothetical protein